MDEEQATMEDQAGRDPTERSAQAPPPPPPPPPTPPPTPSGAVEPARPVRFRDRLWGLRALLAVGIAAVIVGGVGGFAVAKGGERADDGGGPGRFGQHGPGQFGPGQVGPGRHGSGQQGSPPGGRTG